MQKELIVKLTSSLTSTTLATIIFDISQSTEETVTNISQLVGKNITVMHVRYGEVETADGEGTPINDSLVVEQNVKRMQGTGMNTPTLNDLISLINTLGYFGFIYINNTATAISLAAPGTFAATVISTTEIDLSWLAVPNATGYIVQRSTASNFSANLTTVYTGAALLYHNTGLVTATHYYYRIVATATGYANSAYSLANAITD